MAIPPTRKDGRAILRVGHALLKMFLLSSLSSLEMTSNSLSCSSSCFFPKKCSDVDVVDEDNLRGCNNS